MWTILYEEFRNSRREARHNGTMLVILVLEKLKQGDYHEFEANLGYTVSSRP